MANNNKARRDYAMMALTTRDSGSDDDGGGYAMQSSPISCGPGGQQRVATSTDELCEASMILLWYMM